MRKYLIATAAIAALTGAALAQSTALDTGAMPSIDVGSAKIEGNMITGVTATIDKPGYLVIHNDGAGAAPASLGHVAVPAGINANLNVEADGPLDPSSKISLMLHYETNDNTTYDFGPDMTDVDTPTIAGDAPVMAEMPM